MLSLFHVWKFLLHCLLKPDLSGDEFQNLFPYNFEVIASSLSSSPCPWWSLILPVCDLFILIGIHFFLWKFSGFPEIAMPCVHVSPFSTNWFCLTLNSGSFNWWWMSFLPYLPQKIPRTHKIDIRLSGSVCFVYSYLSFILKRHYLGEFVSFLFLCVFVWLFCC